jgi:ATP-dependent exoDNAse (exonuclease V) alpha subunit
LKTVKEILGEVKQPTRYNWNIAFSVATFSAISSVMRRSAIPPRSFHSWSGWWGSSGFSGWRWSSGWGGGGWWGGSW